MIRIFKQPNAPMAAYFGGIGGFLFGYNVAIISGLLLVLSDSMALNTARQANLVSILILGALIGAVAAGFIADKIGRKKTLLATMAAYFLGSLVLIIASNYWIFSLGRIITGIAAGLGAFSIPLYLAEISPNKERGRLVAINQFCVALGILFAYILNYFFDATLNWRYVFILSLIVSAVGAYFMNCLPESPSWLLAMTKRKEARVIIRQFRPHEDADKVVSQIEKHLMNASKDYFMKKIIVPSLIAGVVLAAIHQITGFYSIIYYAPTILQSSGFYLISSATEAAVCIGIVNLIGALASLFLVDKLGRKPLLLGGLIGMSVSLIALALGNFLSFGFLNIWTLIFLLTYVGSFAVGLGSIVFLMLGEIFPMAVRGKVVALCIFVNFLVNYLISLLFIVLFQKVNPSVCFSVFAITTMASIFYIWKFLPETKEKSLEDIEKFWKK